jgi:hypothetical protein
MEKKPITVTAIIEAPIEKVWEFWTFTGTYYPCGTMPAMTGIHPGPPMTFVPGGNFLTRMEAKDGSMVLILVAYTT